MLPVESDVPELLVKMGYGKSGTAHTRAVGDLALIAFYYLLRIGKYTIKGNLLKSDINYTRWWTQSHGGLRTRCALSLRWFKRIRSRRNSGTTGITVLRQKYRYLGIGIQRITTPKGYSREQEDALLGNINWPGKIGFSPPAINQSNWLGGTLSGKKWSLFCLRRDHAKQLL